MGVPRVEKDPRVDTVLLIHGVDTTVAKEEKVPRVEKEEKDPRDLTHRVDTTKTTMVIKTHGVDTTNLKTHGVDTTVLIQKKTVTKSVMNTADPRAVKVEREEKGTTDLMMITPCTMITISTVIAN